MEQYVTAEGCVHRPEFADDNSDCRGRRVTSGMGTVTIVTLWRRGRIRSLRQPTCWQRQSEMWVIEIGTCIFVVEMDSFAGYPPHFVTERPSNSDEWVFEVGLST